MLLPTRLWSLVLLLLPAGGDAKPRALTGRFLHLTDMHPDPYYGYNLSVEGACHSILPDGERAGYWGTPVSECDAPLNLVNSTFDWLEANLKNQVDFIVWTGDNARHDIDSRVPRSMPEIFKLNRYIADRIREIFPGIPVVASIGNNDIYPHNIMFKGPSSITNEFLDIWRHFIPQAQLHNFARGGYYSVDAITDDLLLVSLNAIYMYENNKAVDGCPDYDDSKGGEIDPGTEELMWLEQQLIIARMRGVQAWLTGHVPPTPANWYPKCYAKYSELVLRFHDTVIGQLYGHMNIDHFAFVKDSDLSLESSGDDLDNGPATVAKTTPKSIAEDLRDTYAAIPSKKKTNLSDFSVVNVNPSVIPTYQPALRVWQYNISEDSRWTQPQELETRILVGGTGDANETKEWRLGGPLDEEEEVEDESEDWSTWGGYLSTMTRTIADRLPTFSPAFTSLLTTTFSPSLDYLVEHVGMTSLESMKKKKKKKRKKKHPPRLPRHTSPDSPAMTNRYLTPVGYTQFFLDLEDANLHSGYGPGAAGKKLFEERGENGTRPGLRWEVEYTTFGASELARSLVDGGKGEEGWDQPPPAPTHLFPQSVVVAVGEGEVGEVEVVLRKKGLVPYEMEDLTVGSWVKLARKLAKGGKTWKEFMDKLFVRSGVV